jgi:putative ABC transport system permease protein
MWIVDLSTHHLGGPAVKYLPLVLANLRRSPLRSLLTAAAIALAIALVCLLRTMPEGLESILDYAASGTRVVVLNKAGFDYPLPYAHLQRIRALPGVTSAASWTWYGGMVEVEKGVTFPSFATEPEVIAEVFPDFGLGPEALAAFQSRRDAAIAGRATAQSYGWKAGDRITLVGSLYPVDLELQLVEILPHDLSPVLLFHREYLEQSLRAAGGSLDTASLFYVRVDDRARIEPLQGEIDALFRNSPAQTLSETEKEYFKNMFSALDAFVAITIAVTVIVALSIVFIAANTTSLAVRERAPELAVLRAIGFPKRLVFALLVLEAGILAFGGGAAGAFGSLLLTLGLTGAATSLMSQVGPLGSFVVTRAIVVQGLFLALFVGMLAGVVPSFGAARKSVAETLREIF